MTRKPTSDRDYEVGYGKPPRHSRFKKGKSGNSSGKSKSQKGLKQLLHEEGEKLIKIVENGHEQTLAKKELIAKAIIAKACKGDLAAAKFIVSQLASSEQQTPTSNFSWDEEEEALLEEIRKAVKEEEGEGE
jgi:hypothetical protein